MITIDIDFKDGTNAVKDMTLREYLEMLFESELPFDSMLNESDIRDELIIVLNQLIEMPDYNIRYGHLAVLAYFGTDLWKEMIKIFTQESILIILGKFPWISKTFECVDPLINSVISITR